MANLLKRWVESDKRELKRLGKIADKVESYADEFGALSDDELKAKTEEFKKRYQDGEMIYYLKLLLSAEKVQKGY